ncbi:MAG: MFS transporter [Myxococcaceae bacterium]
MKATRKLALLATLYLAQGLPYGFFVQALPVLLRTRGFSLPEIGLANLLALPWALKFLAAPLADRLHLPQVGRRRGLIVPLQLASAVCVFALAWLSASDISWLLAGVLVVNALSALQDVATDGLAVDLLSERERGLGNGVQVAGYRVGMILGGGVLLVVSASLGWSGTFVAMAGLMLVATVPVLLYREPPALSMPATEPVGWWREFASWYRRPGAAGWLLLLVVYKFGDALGQAMLRPMLVDQGLGEEQLGYLLGGVGFTTGLVGALLGGALVNRLSPKSGLILFGVLQSLAVLGYAWAASGIGLGALTVVCAVEHLTGGMATAALFTRMMDATRPDRAATDYTVQACVVVLGTGAAAALSGFTASALGYAGHFALATALSFGGVAYVALHRFRIFRSQEFGPCPSRSTQAPSIP